MNRNLRLVSIVGLCAFGLLLCTGCTGVGGNSGIPLQPGNPYFYNIQTPFDIVRALIDTFVPFS